MVRESNSMLRQVRDKFEHPVQGKNGIHILKITWDHRMQTLPLKITPRVSTLKQPCSTVVKTDHRTANRAAGPLHPSPALSQGAHSSSLSSGVLVNWLSRGKNRAGGKAERGREQKIKKGMEGGREKGNWKPQESVSPPRQQLYWQNLSGITILELWSLSKA